MREFHKVLASSFADPVDIAAFKICKARGGTDEACFKVGDNGIGYFHEFDCTGNTPCCALPRQIWLEKWGSSKEAALKRVIVRANGQEVVCLLADTMPRLENIQNGCGIDLNPAASKALGLKPPFKVKAEWAWE